MGTGRGWGGGGGGGGGGYIVWHYINTIRRKLCFAEGKIYNITQYYLIMDKRKKDLQS